MLVRFSLSSFNILIASILNSASDRLLVSILFSSFPGVLIYSFMWAMFLCLLILASPLHLCLFLCIKQSSYVPQAWQSGLMQQVSCRVQQHSLLYYSSWVLKVHALCRLYTILLQLSLDCCWHVQGQPLPVFFPGSESISYTVICRCLLLVLGWKVPRPNCEPRPAAASPQPGAT